jgi:uncharacterized phiE125 gp8 family phage protein
MIIAKSLDKHGDRDWKVTTPPLVEPITVDELKEYAKIDGSDEDNILANTIKAIREAMEEYLGRSLIEQTIKLSMDFWPGEVIELPMPPLISVTQVVLVDESDVETVYASSNYYVETLRSVGRLVLKQGVTYPNNTDRTHGGYRIDYKAGYGTAGADVPQVIREAIKLWCAVYYETGTLTEKPPNQVLSMVERTYRIPRV